MKGNVFLKLHRNKLQQAFDECDCSQERKKSTITPDLQPEFALLDERYKNINYIKTQSSTQTTRPGKENINLANSQDANGNS